MKKFRFTRIILIAAAVLAVAFALSPAYLKKAVFYQSPDIDDYRIFNNRVVASADEQPWMEAAGYNDREVPESFRKEFKKLKTVAFLVIRDQEVRFEKYWDGFDRETLSNSFSISRSLVSLLVGAALDEGALKSVDQPVGDYLPEYRNGDKSKITIRNLLEMSSGLDWKDQYTNNFSLMSRAYYGNDLTALVYSREAINPPGKVFDYEGINTELLSLVVQSATHMNLSSYAAAKLWQPMGAGHDALWSLDQPNGTEKAFCCFNADVRDLARLGQLILNRGSWAGKQLVSWEYLRNALSPDPNLKTSDGKQVNFYGWHFWLTDFQGMPICLMGGEGGQYVIVIPEANTVIVRLGKKTSDDRIRGIPSDFYTWTQAGLELAGS